MPLGRRGVPEIDSGRMYRARIASVCICWGLARELRASVGCDIDAAVLYHGLRFHLSTLRRAV